MPFFMGGKSYSGDGALLVNPNTPASTDTFNAPFRVDPVGMVYVDYTNSPAATDPRNAGFAFTHTGQLYCTTSAVGATSVVSNGVARTATGVVHISFTEPAVKNAGPLGVVDEDGVLYVAAPIETQAAWFRFKLGITSSAGFASQWNDQSGNSRHLKQATATNQPAVQSDLSILFDGSDNFMKCDAFTLNQPETVYLLGKQVTWSSGDYWCDGNIDARMIIQQTNLGASPQLRLFAGLGTGSNSDLAVDTYGVIAAVFNGASSVLQVNKGTAVTGNVGANNAAGFTLGASGGVVAGFSNIRIKEVLLYAAAHDSDQILRVVNYLSAIGDLGL